MPAAMLHQRLAELESNVRLLVESIRSPDAPADVGLPSQEAFSRIIAAEQRRIEIRTEVCPPKARDQTAWSILVAAYRAHDEGKVLSVTALGSFAHAPTTTALRWLDELVAEGLLTSRPDETDRRRRRIAISCTGRSALRAYAAKIGAER